MKVVILILIILLILILMVLWFLNWNRRISFENSTLYEHLSPVYRDILSNFFYEALSKSRFVPRRALWLFKVASLLLPWSVVHGFVWRFLDLDSGADDPEVSARLQSLIWRPGGRALMVWLRSFYLFGELSGPPSDTELIKERRWD